MVRDYRGWISGSWGQRGAELLFSFPNRLPNLPKASHLLFFLLRPYAVDCRVYMKIYQANSYDRRNPAVPRSID
jgi:hypothetical protein